ncbi:J domain-containing protein [Massilia oculi]|uniref:J domain-containing protein n=1 Tax=Massilia hydrophila TaxID=3044279 RepID=A0ABS7Y9D8_9BURK|nr:J domain-containing protein [Massilia oculi]MCA1855973.1 J domain-containing protein [Massilia oculi]
MAKIHTHYDNLKVARGAPAEVIRAAYKALSQKYHPDKNPGDEKAARIMAIVNTAYNTLSDPVRRKEHDEWIASEEWEVEWLESSGAEEGGGQAGRSRPDHWEPHSADAPARRRPRLMRDPRWWLGLAGCFVAGAGATVLLLDAPREGWPAALAWAGKPAAAVSVPAPVPVSAPTAAATPASASAQAAAPERAERAEEPGADAEGWARPAGGEGMAPPPEVKALAVAQLAVPARVPGCATGLQTLHAPGGAPWPAESGYLPGYPAGNNGAEMQVQIDNGANASPIFVKLYDLDRRIHVRHAYVQPHGSFTIDKLSAGRYEVRYQNILAADGKGACPDAASGQPPLRQAAAFAPGG